MNSKENSSALRYEASIHLLRLKAIGRMIFLKGLEKEVDLSEIQADEVYTIGELILSSVEEIEQIFKEVTG